MRVALAVVVVVSAGCSCDPGDPDKDRTAPRVLSVDPADPVVAVDAAFVITLSEDILESTVVADPTAELFTVALVPRSSSLDEFFADFDNPPLSPSRQDEPIAVDVDVRGDQLQITPVAPLDPLTAYELMLGSDITDAARNPLIDGTGLKAVFRYDFETDAGQPQVLDVDVDGPGLVAPNRRRVLVVFDQPVQNVGNDTLTFSPAVPVDAILATEEACPPAPAGAPPRSATCTNVTVLVGEGPGCNRFTSSTEYTVSVSADVVGVTGQRLVPFSATFTTGAACDSAPNLIIDGVDPGFEGDVDAIPGEVAAIISWETTKASTTEVRFGARGGVLDCLGAPCPVTGAAARFPIAGSSPPRFLHSVELVGLTLNAPYDVVVSAEDDVGNTATASVGFETAPLPKVAINEVMANPSTSSEATGEYVELVNFGDTAEDISGWLLLVGGGDDNGGCTAQLPDALSLPAGAFLIIGGVNFSEEHYVLGPEVPVVQLASSSGANAMCGLTNTPKAYLLADSDGRPVSTVSSHPSTNPDENGISVERTDPAAADVDASFCLANDAVGATPGRANSVAVSGCQ